MLAIVDFTLFNHFETRFKVLSQQVDFKLLRMASSLKNFDEKKSKMAIEIGEILDLFLRNGF